MRNRAVFLDRDGTLIEEKHYLSRPEDVHFIPGVVGALQSLMQANFKLFLVTNQSGIGRGFFTWDDLKKVHDHLIASLGNEGVRFEKIYVAPETQETVSRWRKPSPQSLIDARDEYGLDLGQSYFVGDKWIDLECGSQAGVRKSVLVRTGYGRQTEREYQGQLRAVVVVDDLPAAAAWILAHA